MSIPPLNTRQLFIMPPIDLRQKDKNMNYLSHYTEQATSDLFDSKGAFFAFNKEQLDKGRAEGVTYVSMGSGLICPKDNATALKDGLHNVYKTGRELDLRENGKKAIIWRELANHECQISYDYTDAKDALEGYPITEEDIKEVWGEFIDYCNKNDMF